MQQLSVGSDIKMHQNNQSYVYNPHFHWSFLHPRYWGTWLAILISAFVSCLPIVCQLFIARRLARIALKLKNKANRRARVNLSMCFPEQTHVEQNELIYQSYVTSLTYLMNFSSVTLRSQAWLEQHTRIHGLHYLTDAINQGQKVILLVPHTWAIDIGAILLASRGMPVASIVKAQKNPLSDWLLNKQRVQYGGRVYERNEGLKPLVKSIRKDGYIGYYLPDEDLGRENSVFTSFFATQKATLSGIGRLATLSQAKVIPLFVTFDPEKRQFVMHFDQALPVPSENVTQDARLMNEFIETYVTRYPEQYMWILRLLKTRPELDVNPYAS